MKRSWGCAVVVAAVVVVFSLPPPASAQTTQVEGVTVTSADVHEFLAALHQALQPNDATVPVFVSVKPASQMPAYDQHAHYAGMEKMASGAIHLNIWVDADLKGDMLQNALLAAFALAVADGGYGGSAFKQLYDIYAARDAQLPADAPDPYLNRHKFAAALVHFIETGTQ